MRVRLCEQAGLYDPGGRPRPPSPAVGDMRVKEEWGLTVLGPRAGHPPNGLVTAVLAPPEPLRELGLRAGLTLLLRLTATEP